jgi:hypothetical protein
VKPGESAFCNPEMGILPEEYVKDFNFEVGDAFVEKKPELEHVTTT